MLGALLVGVGVEAAEADRVDLGRDAGLDAAGDDLELPGQAALPTGRAPGLASSSVVGRLGAARSVQRRAERRRRGQQRAGGPAAIAWLGGSAGSAAASCLTPAPIGPVGAANRSAAARRRPPSRHGQRRQGRADRDTASGVGLVASSQRPIHPVVAGRSGEPVCQMAIERKWLRSGFG